MECRTTNERAKRVELLAEMQQNHTTLATLSFEMVFFSARAMFALCFHYHIKISIIMVSSTLPPLDGSRSKGVFMTWIEWVSARQNVAIK